MTVRTIVSPSSELSKVMVSPEAAASRADRSVIVPAGGAASSSRELTTNSGFIVLSFEEHPPAARARASGITHNTMREHFMESLLTGIPLTIDGTSIGLSPRFCQIEPGSPRVLTES